MILAADSRLAIDRAGIDIIKSFPGNDLAAFTGSELTQIKLAEQYGVQ
jgi:hypothetical protein